MNIVYVSHYSGQGGANGELVLLIEQMKKRGHHIFVVMPNKGWLYDKLTETCECIVFPYHRWVEKKDLMVGIIKKAAKLILNWRAAIHLYRYFKSKSIDLVHTNDSITITGAYLANLLNVPHIWHMREIFDDQFDLKHTFSERYCSKWLQRADTVIAISKAVEDRYNKYKNLNIVQIYDGIEMPDYSTKKDKNNCINFLFCGGTSIHKGFDDVIAIAKKMQEEKIDFSITIASSCDINSTLKQKLIDYKIYDKINFIGFVNNLETIRRQSDILLMCSQKEAFGLVTVEAMLSKLLVIGRNSGATSELIEHKKTGYLYNNIEELWECISIALNRNNEDIIENAYKYAKDEFSIDSTANSIQQIYERIRVNGNF